MKNTIYSMALLMGLTASLAWADETPSQQREEVIEKRIDKQEMRIQQGVKAGALTPREAKGLEKREDKIKVDNSKALSDGKLSKGEFKKIQREQNQASRAIKRKKHNRVVVPSKKQ